MKVRYAFMDVVRFVSMIGIVYYHMVVSLYLCGIRQYESISPMFENKNMHVATVGVGLFFMISGAGLMLSTKDKEHLNLKEYYLKRFLRVLVPFYLVYALYIVWFLIVTHQGLGAIYDGDIKPISFIFTLLGMDAYISSFGIPTYSVGIGEWFLGALVMMYIIFPILRWALLKNKWITLGCMSIYFIIIIIVYPVFPFANVVPGFTNFLCKVYEFFLGMFLITVVDKIPKWLKLYVTIPVIGFFLIYPLKLPINQNLMILIENLAFMLLFMGLEGFFNKIPRVIKAVTACCGISYEFFLVHHKVIDYMTLQHIGVPFSNKDILVLFVEEFFVILLLTIIVKVILTAPRRIFGTHER